ncbi:MAG: glycosyltransferase family 39 protein [Acidobacteria bacterium]|nr:glycosyltransferase family 39 protein [Acidobacteriota bacterium]
MPDRRRGDLCLLLGALALRLAWAREMSALPFFDMPTSDSLFYARTAADIAAGHVVGSGLAYPSSPLYPYLIAPFFLMSGRAAFAGVYLLQALLDAASAVLIKRTAAALFGRAAGWVAGLAWAAYGLAVFFTADLMEATAAAFFASLFLYLAVRAPTSTSRRLVTGTALAAAVLLRPHFFLVLPIAIAGAAWLAPLEERRRATALLCLGAILPLGLSLARNLAASGEMVLVSPYSGLNAYLGNHRGASGNLEFPPGKGLRNDVDLKEAAHAYPEAMEKRPLSESEVSQFWWGETLREIEADPAAWGALLARKVALFWSPRETPNHLDFEVFRPASPSLSAAVVPFALAGPAALCGLALVVGGAFHDRRVIVLAILVAAYNGACAIFFVADRFRLPAAGWIVVLGAGAATEIAARARSGRTAAAVWPLVVAVSAGVLLYVPAPLASGARERVMIAATLLWRGRALEAEMLLRNAVAIDPKSAVASFNLGRLLVATGRWDDAQSVFAEAVRLSPEFAPARAALGDLAKRRGTPEGRARARALYESALAIEPYGRDADRVRRELAGLESR